MSNLHAPKRLASFDKMVKSDLLSKILNKVTQENFIPSYEDYLALNESKRWSHLFEQLKAYL